jgi:hypothetical protein
MHGLIKPVSHNALIFGEYRRCVMTHPIVITAGPWARNDHFGVDWKLVFHYVCTVSLLIKTICQ